MPELAKLSLETPVDTMVDIMRRDGGFILKGVLSSEQVAQTRREVDPFLEATPPGKDDFGGAHTKRTGALIARSAAVREMALNPIYNQVAEAFLKPYGERLRISLTQILHIMPGQTRQQLHRDQRAWSRLLDHIECEVSVIHALTDFTADNGATMVVPGSGAWPPERVAQPEEAVPAIMDAGDALIYSGRLWHGGGENKSSANRTGLQLVYALAWLRQEENQYLSCPPEIAKDFPIELTRLIGYDLARYSMGYYTPPAAPGEAPEITNPEHALTGRGLSGYIGVARDMESIATETAERLAAMASPNA